MDWEFILFYIVLPSVTGALVISTGMFVSRVSKLGKAYSKMNDLMCLYADELATGLFGCNVNK